jgi:hypothetical protein
LLSANKKVRLDEAKPVHITMISAIEWIPVGRANPNPSKYEYSRAERDFLSQLAASQLQTEVEEGEGTISIDPSAKETGGDETGSNDDEWEDVDDDEEEEEEEEEDKGSDAEPTHAGKLPKVDPSSLPADLRMDEYSDDDDDDDNDDERDVGGLLGVGKVRLVVCIGHELLAYYYLCV